MTTVKVEKTALITIVSVGTKFDADGKEVREWTVKFPWSQYQQAFLVPHELPVPRNGEQLTVVLVRGKPRGTSPNPDVPERGYWWNFGHLLPPAGDTPVVDPPRREEPPFPVAGATKERPQNAPVAPAAQSAPQREESDKSTPKEAPAPPEQRPGEYLDTLDCPPLITTADRYAGVNERYHSWHTDRRAALERAVILGGTDQEILARAELIFAWLRGVAE